MFKGWLVVPSLLLMLIAVPLQALAISGIDPATRNNFSSPEEAADKSIAILRKLKDDARAKELGFMSAVEAHQAQRGVPLRVFRVRLDKLQNFQPGDDPEQLLFDTHSILYPIRVECSSGPPPSPCRDGQVRSSVTVHESQKAPGGWRATMRGAAKLITSLEKFRTSDSNFIIWVIAVNVFILGDLTGGQFTMIPIEDKYGMNAGQSLPALDALARFVRLAGDLEDDDDEEDFNIGAT